MEWRLVTPSRSGPVFAPTPPTAWQVMQFFSTNSCRPYSGPGIEAHAGEVGAHLFAGEREHVIGEVARLLLGEVEVGHGRAGGDRVGSEEVALQPLRRAVVCAFCGQVGTDASAHAIELVAAAAALGFKEVAALGQLRHAGHFAFLVAAAAGGANVVLGEQRIGPEIDLAVRALLVGGQALAAVADGAAEPGGNVRAEIGVIAEGLRRILHRRVFHAQVAGGAAVHALQAGEQTW